MCSSLKLTLNNNQISKSLTLLMLLNLSVTCFSRESEALKIIQKSCIECHDEDIQKGDLRLDNLALPGDEPKAMHTWLEVYDMVESGEMPPKKKQFSEEQRTELLEALAKEMSAYDESQKKSSGRVILRRLSATEYEYSVRDLLHLPNLQVKHYLPADRKHHGIENVAENQQIAYNQISMYLKAAESSLQAAVTLRPKPEKKTKRTPGVRTGAASKVFQKGYKHVDDKLVLIREPDLSQGPWSLVTSPVEPGYYKIRLKVHTAQLKDSAFKTSAVNADNSLLLPGKTKQTVALGIALGRYLKSFDIHPESSIQECTVWLHGKERLSLNCVDLPLRSDRYTTGRHPEIWDAVALEWVEIEGPIISQWPPQSHKALFGDLPVKKWSANSGLLEPRTINSGTGEERRDISPKRGTYFVESENPEKDSFRLLKSFMERAYRRSVTEDEVKYMQAQVLNGLKDKLCFQDAMLIAYKAILCSPDFLYIHEKPGRLSSVELASRLALFLWRSIPDEQLMNIAKSGRLKDRKVFIAEAKRMLEDPKANRFIDDFTEQWLKLESIYATVPDKTLYPEYHEKYLLIESMVQETKTYIRELLNENLPVINVVDSDYAFLNEQLAEHYGIPGVTGSELRKVKLPKNSIRGGVITQGSILKISANGFTTSPVQRGIWVLERILGTPPPNPPPNAGSVEPDIRGAKTIREQLDKHRAVESCATCHTKIDPPGFALESFDVMGGFRTKYRSMSGGKRKTINDGIILYKIREAQPIDATGVFMGEKFTDIKNFKNILVKNERQIARNIVNRIITQATGAVPNFSDREVIEKLLDSSAKNGFRLKSIIGRILLTPMFLEK